jgi:hypothetical protein
LDELDRLHWERYFIATRRASANSRLLSGASSNRTVSARGKDRVFCETNRV